MGFIEVFPKIQYAQIHAMWDNFIDFNLVKQDTLIEPVHEPIDNETRIILGPNQALVLFVDGKYLDSAVGPAGFIYHDSFEPGAFTQEGREWTEKIREENGDILAETTEGEKRCFLMRLDITHKSEFSFGDVSYYDVVAKGNIRISGKGTFTYGVAHPLLYFAAVKGDLDYMLEHADEPGFGLTEFNPDQDFEQAASVAISKFSARKMPYNRIPYESFTLCEDFNEVLRTGWTVKHGMKITGIQFRELYPDETSIKLILRVQREQALQRENQKQQTGMPPYTQQPYAQQPYTQQPYTQQSYAGQPPYVGQPYAQQPYAGQPYAQQPYAGQPYAQQPYAGQPYVQQPYAQPPYIQPPTNQQQVWVCMHCGQQSVGRFCKSCGASR